MSQDKKSQPNANPALSSFVTPNFHRRYVSLNRHPLTPCLFCLHICPASYDPAPVVLSVLTTQSGSVHDRRAPRRTSTVLSAFLGHPGTTCPGIIERLPGQEFATPLTWDTSWSPSAFASHRAGTMPFSCKLGRREVGSKHGQIGLSCCIGSASVGAQSLWARLEIRDRDTSSAVLLLALGHHRSW